MARFVYQAILTPDEEGDRGYDVSFPDLPGCFTFGDDLEESIWMATDAASTWVASKMKHGEAVPRAQEHAIPDGAKSVWISFETSPDYIVDGPVVTAAEASRMLGITAGRVTRMLDSGILEGYRMGRHTYITTASIEARKKESPHVGRPRQKNVVA